MIKSRSPLPELMDDPDSDTAKLIRTVKQFKFINIILSGSRKLIKRHFLKGLTPGREVPYRFLDIGAGGCDIALWISMWCRKRNINIELVCIENDSRIIPYARDQIEHTENITLIETSAFNISDHEKYDFIFSNHFLHHLDNQSIQELINLMNEKSSSFLMNDLKRSLLSFIGYKIFAFIFLHNSFANYDGGLSILRGFRKKELFDILETTVCKETVSIKQAIPGRIYLQK